MSSKKKPEGYVFGRPTSYDKEKMFPIIMQIAKEGGSKEEIAANIGIARGTLYNWCNKNHANFQPDFLDAITHAETIALAWWEKVGRTAIYLDKFQSALFNKQIAGRFPDKYREKQEITGDRNAPLSVSLIKYEVND